MLKTNKSKVNTLSVATFVLLITLVFITSVTTSPALDSTHEEVTVITTTATDEPTPMTVRNRPTFTTSQAVENPSDVTEPAVIEITLAPVEIPSGRVAEILEANDVQYVPSTGRAQSAPPKDKQQSDTISVIDGQKHVWHPDFGWVPDYGEGTVIVMDVEDDGRRYAGGW